ncbi:MAG: immunity protein Imm33 domain-containing protein [Maricaulaceae bacterium]
MDDALNLSFLDLNTVANYDPDIISYLSYPTGTEIERGTDGKLTLISPDTPVPNIHYLRPPREGACAALRVLAHDGTVFDVAPY